MRKWTKTAGLLFLAAASVYSYRVIEAASGSKGTEQVSANVAAAAILPSDSSEKLIGAPAEGNTDVKLLEDTTDPFASGAATQPSGGEAATAATQPAADGAAPTSQPSEGRSVSSSEVSVSDAGTVEIHVNDANLVEVLRMLSLQSQKNIIASKDVHGTVTANLYDVTVREALDAILHANGYAYREKGNFIYVYTSKEIAEIEKAERQMKTEVFRVFYTPAADAAIMIKPVLSKAGGEVAVSAPAKVGIASAPNGGGGDAASNNDVLVVTDYPENLDAVRKLLGDIDRRPQQILLEATILRATLNEDNALGIDFNIVGGVDMTTFTHANGQISNADVGDTGNGRVHSVGTGNAFSSPINGGLKVGFVTNSVSMFLAALEQVTDTTILANPKVLALNKQQGEVFVGNEDGYYTTITTETTTSQSVESLKTGTRLIFRPFIANDGFIRMEVHPEDSDGQVKANGLPSKSTTEVTSNVMLKDGHTIVIGGLFRESSVSGKSQIPFFGNLPIAGTLFKNQKDQTKRDEVIILLTPHIVKDDASYSRLSEEELKRADQLRVGVRRGMMPWGRERLAEGWYEGAKKEMAKENPNRGMAKWQLDCATNLNPKFLEAIELKQQITGVEVTSADNSAMRTFVRRAVLNDVEPTTMPARAENDDLKTAPTSAPSVASVDQTSAAAAPTSQPSSGEETVTVPTTQPWSTESAAATTQPNSESDDDTASASNDQAMTEQAQKAETDQAPAAAPATTAPVTGTAEASVADESVAIPPTSQPATDDNNKKANQPQSKGESDTDELLTDPLAVPSTQPAASDESHTNATTVTPLPDDSVPGEIKDDQGQTEQSK